METYLVYIDPGHGGKDCGALKYLNERDEVLPQGKACGAYLKALGVNVKMSRIDNIRNISTHERAREANTCGADLYVSLHLNAFNGKAKGFEIYHASKSVKGKKLALEIAKVFCDELGQEVHGANNKPSSALKADDSLNVIRETNAPAVLVESCYVDNREDALDFCPTTYGYAVAKGICKYLNIKGKVYEAKANLNVHSSASVNGEIIGKVSKGELVKGTVEGTWVKIKLGKATGYVRYKTSVRQYMEEV